jgi:hypothetical protein
VVSDRIHVRATVSSRADCGGGDLLVAVCSIGQVAQLPRDGLPDLLVSSLFSLAGSAISAVPGVAQFRPYRAGGQCCVSCLPAAKCFIRQQVCCCLEVPSVTVVQSLALFFFLRTHQRVNSSCGFCTFFRACAWCTDATGASRCARSSALWRWCSRESQKPRAADLDVTSLHVATQARAFDTLRCMPSSKAGNNASR